MSTPDIFIKQFNQNEYAFVIESFYDETQPHTITIIPQSDIETYNSPIFLNAILETLKNFKQLNEVKLDFNKVNYMSSTGIGNLLQILKYTNANAIHLSISHVNSAIQSTIDLLGFTNFLPLNR
jgi:anti-anti-sigma factor